MACLLKIEEVVFPPVEKKTRQPALLVLILEVMLY